MRVLGIDPGLTRCGLGVVEGSVGRPLRLVAVDVARTDAGLPAADRLWAIAAEIDAWIERHAPDAVAVERVFLGAQLPGSAGDRRALIAELTGRSNGEIAAGLSADSGYTELGELDAQRAEQVGAAFRHDCASASR